MDSRSKRAAERIREEVSLFKILMDYGYRIHDAGEDREQQFSCDLHGDGSDNTASARYYPETGQFYCWGCQKSRDAIALVREKEGLQFWEAVKFLEKKYGLDPLPWTADDREPPSTRDDIDKAFSTDETAEQALKRVERFIDGVTRDKSLPAVKCAGLWEVFDRISLLCREGLSESEAIRLSHQVLDKAKEALKNRGEHGSV